MLCFVSEARCSSIYRPLECVLVVAFSERLLALFCAHFFWYSGVFHFSHNSRHVPSPIQSGQISSFGPRLLRASESMLERRVEHALSKALLITPSSSFFHVHFSCKNNDVYNFWQIY